ncbi:lipid droplet phospholipase 1-like isoform X2 [Carex rostrata]
MLCPTSLGTGSSLHQPHKRVMSGFQRSERRNMDLIHWVGDLQRRWSTWRSSSATSLSTQVETESSGTGQDMLSLGHFPEHLVIMVNGLGGSPNDWKFADEELVKRFPDKVVVHRSQCNTAKLTYDGVDRMGERLADEVRSVVEKRRGVTKISFVAHSLGGLIARYAIGILYSHETVSDGSLDEELKGRIAGLEPINFITSATPHLGSRGHKQLPFLFGISILERTAVETAHLIIGRTGKHLFLTDQDDGKPPLLVRMTEDQDDIKFISALRAFKRRVAYANSSYDHIVGWRTSSFRRPHELPKELRCPYDDKYPNIVHVENGNLDNGEKLDNAVVTQTDDFEG